MITSSPRSKIIHQPRKKFEKLESVWRICKVIGSCSKQCDPFLFMLTIIAAPFLDVSEVSNGKFAIVNSELSMTNADEKSLSLVN